MSRWWMIVLSRKRGKGVSVYGWLNAIVHCIVSVFGTTTKYHGDACWSRTDTNVIGLSLTSSAKRKETLKSLRSVTEVSKKMWLSTDLWLTPLATSLLDDALPLIDTLNVLPLKRFCQSNNCTLNTKDSELQDQTSFVEVDRGHVEVKKNRVHGIAAIEAIFSTIMGNFRRLDISCRKPFFNFENTSALCRRII